MGSNLPTLEAWFQSVIDSLPRLGGAALILLVGWLISTHMSRLIGRAMERRQADRQLIVLLQLISRWGVFFLALVLALEQLFPGRLNSLIAGLGIAGFTIGFALQDVAKNFIAGLLLLLQKPFQIGEAIEVAGYGGSVLGITLRSTELRTWDGRHVILPNAEVLSQPIVNFSRGPVRRVDLTVALTHGSDLNKTSRAALAALGRIPGLLEDPAPQVAFREFADRAIILTAYYWVDTRRTSMLEVQDAGVRQLKAAFDAEGIEITPTPLDVRVTVG
ncbi:MAG: mechanosensitive ion channel [Chloroflexota bacterium]